MTEAQFRNELVYQMTMASVRKLLRQDIITKAEYTVIDTRMLRKYAPLLGGIYH